jgi:hypothetical protein
MRRRLTRLSLILTAVLAVASIAFAGTAMAGKTRSTTTVSIKSQGHLVTSPTQGAGANVTVTYSCFPVPGGYYAFFGQVGLIDIHGHSGFNFFTARCNDVSHTAVVFISGPFTAGAAAANAFVCGFDCLGTSREIRLS